VKSGWPQVHLWEVLEERRESPSHEDLDRGQIPILAKIRFGDGTFELRESSNTNTKMILGYPGDLLISGINAAKGAITLCPEDPGFPVAATIHYAAYKVNRTRAVGRYLWWLLRSRLFRRILADSVPGGIKTELKPKRLLPIKVPLPSLDTQRILVGRIEACAKDLQEASLARRVADCETRILMDAAIGRLLADCPMDGVFGDVVSFKPRSGPSFVTDPEWRGTPVLMPSSVSGFGVNPHRVEYGLGEEKLDPKDRLLEGDLLIARGNKPEQVGNAGVVPRQCFGLVSRICG
jgi:hypothetical protein